MTTKELLSAGLDEMRRIIREKEPDAPSTDSAERWRKHASKVESPQSAVVNSVTPSIATDLDWIVMKALEKDRTRRYETANGLAADLKRYLNNEPVVARPPSRLYEFQKTVRRHKVGFAATAAIIMVLLAGVLVSTWQAVRATRAEQGAIVEQQRANRVTAFLQQMLATANPDSSKSPDYTVREMLDDFARKIDAQFADDPEVAAGLHTTLGKAYWNMQEGPKAKAQLARALELQTTAHGTNSAEFAGALVNYAETPSINASAAELEECAANLRRALAIYQERGIKGYPVIHALWALQMVLDKKGKRNHIEELVTEAKAQARQTPGSNYWELAAMNIGLINAKADEGNYAEAERIASETIANNNRQFGADYIQTAWVYYVLTYALLPQSKYEEALDAAKHAVAIMRKRISPDQIWYGNQLQAVLATLTAARSARALTNLFSSASQLEKLEPMFLERLGSQPLSPNSGNDPVNVAMRAVPQFPGFYLELADEMSAADRTNEAAECRRKAATFYEQLETRNSSDPDLLARLYLDRIQSLVQQSDSAEANKLREKLLALQHLNASSLNAVAWTLATSPFTELRNGSTAVIDAEKAVATTGRTNVAYLDTLAAAYAEAGQFDQAVATEKEVIQLLSAGNADQYYAQCLSLYESSIPYRDAGALAENVLALLQAVKFAEAESPARECLRLREKLMPDDWRTCNAQSMLGGSLLGQKKYAEAAPLLLSGYEGMIQREEQIPANVRQRRLKEALQRLAEFYQATGQTEKAATEADTVLSDTNVASSTFLPGEFLKRQLAQWSPENTLSSMQLAFALAWTGQTNEYEAFCRKVLDYATNSNDATIERAAKAYLIRGSNPSLLKLAVSLDERAWGIGKDGEFREWIPMNLGLARYREQDYAGALEILAQPVTASDPLIKGPSLMIQAMAIQQLGRTDEARKSFQTGESLMASPPPAGQLTEDVLINQDGVFFWLLHAEAKALIKGDDVDN